MNEQLPFYWKSRDAYNKADRLLLDQLKRTEDAAVLLQLGQLRLAMEDYSEAESYLARAIEKDKDSPEAYQTLGVVCTRKERYEKAIKCFEDSLKRDPDNLTVRSNLAEAYYKAKKVDKAEAEFRRILEITPNHVESLIGLGEVYTLIAEDGDGDMYDRAIMYFSRGKKTGEQGEGSKKLKKKDLAALLYSRGYARINCTRHQKFNETKNSSQRPSEILTNVCAMIRSIIRPVALWRRLERDAGLSPPNRCGKGQALGSSPSWPSQFW